MDPVLSGVEGQSSWEICAVRIFLWPGEILLEGHAIS